MNKALYKVIDNVYLKCPDALRQLKQTFNYMELKAKTEMARAEWDEKSERWQESEDGQEQNEQISRAESIVEELEMAFRCIEQAHEAFLEIAQNAPAGSFNSAE